MVLRKTSLAEQAYQEISKWIISGRLEPGVRLTEEGMSEKLGISRTPVREAFKQLGHAQLVEMLPGRGCQVKALKVEEIRQLFECRAEIEKVIMRRSLARIPEARIRAELTKLERVGSEDELRRNVIEVDQAIHQFSVDYSDNGPLAEIQRQLLLQSVPFRNYRNFQPSVTVEQLISERREILEAMLARDGEKLSLCLTEHIKKGTENL